MINQLLSVSGQSILGSLTSCDINIEYNHYTTMNYRKTQYKFSIIYLISLFLKGETGRLVVYTVLTEYACISWHSYNQQKLLLFRRTSSPTHITLELRQSLSLNSLELVSAVIMGLSQDSHATARLRRASRSPSHQACLRPACVLRRQLCHLAVSRP